MMAGAAVWMTAHDAPPAWIAPMALLAAVAAATVCTLAPVGGRGVIRVIVAGACALAAAFALGAVAVDTRTRLVAAPRLAEDLGPARIEGWVMDAEPGATRARMKILVHAIEGLAEPPRYVRLSASSVVSPGRAVRCLSLLRPPEGPLAPRSFDFARRAWFQRIGATGVVLGRCRPIVLAAPENWFDRLALRITALRRDLTEAIVTSSPGEGGAIAAALVTGDRSFMSDATNTAFRDSGLGHLLSVSGLHMALVAGGIFAALHLLLALVAPLALRFPIRKWAAGAALIGAAAYLVVSGASVPAQRAFIMTAVALGAVLLDRPPFSLRALGLAAIIVVALAPESVVDPGFQMSFAATAALIAAFERPLENAAPLAPGLILGGLDGAWRLLSGMLVASLVAGLATDIFAVFHFQRIAIYGLAANVAATPLISFVIAPAAVLAAALAPLGASDLPLAVMSGALDMVASIGRVFAERPEAVRPLPLAPVSAFVIAIAALVWACLWRGALRWLAVPVLLGSVALYALSPRGVIFADGDLRAVVARTEAGWIAASSPRRGDFARGRLGGLAGLGALQIEGLPAPENCDAAACAWLTPRGRAVFLLRRIEDLDRACVRVAIVLSEVPVPPGFRRRCAPLFVADPRDLASKGGLIVSETADGIMVRRARDDAGRRVWSGRLRRIDG